MGFRVPPVVPFLVALGAQRALAVYAPVATLEPPAIRFLALIPAALGIGLAVSALALFSTAGTQVRPFAVASALVTAGPYRFSRNPIYLGMALLLVAAALVARCATPWLVVPVFVWWIQTQVIAVEEDMLEARFGDDYRAYRRRVRRWLGWRR